MKDSYVLVPATGQSLHLSIKRLSLLVSSRHNDPRAYCDKGQR